MDVYFVLHIPAVEFLSHIVTTFSKHAHQMDEGALPYTKFKLVHEIGGKNVVEVDFVRRKSDREGTLHSNVNYVYK